MLVHQIIYQGSKNKVALYDKHPITYIELQRYVELFRNYFYQQGVRQGDKVGLYSKNSAEYIYSYLAIVSLGAVVVPLNYQWVSREVAYIIKDANILVLVTMGVLNLEEKLEKFNYDKDLVQLVIPEFANIISDMHLPQVDAVDNIDADEVCAIIYTSGTTGYPKGAMLTHNNLISNAKAVIEFLSLNADDRVLCILPMYHCFAWTCAVLLPLLMGASILIMDSFSIRETIAAIRSEKISVVYGIPAMFKLFAAWAAPADFDNVRVFISGGTALPKEILQQFEAKIGRTINEGYGLSEASPVVTVTPVDKIKYCSIGKPLPGVSVKIVDENDNILPNGEIGELLVCGPNVMKGYYNLPEESAEVLRGGWLHTGDLAYQDDEGYVFIVDRLKDMIITNAENIYPREIEELLYAYPEVVEAAVVGIPDKLRGNAVRAYIVATEGQTIDKKALREYLKVRLASYKVPREIIQVETLPKNSTGKILKKVLREQISSQVKQII